MGCCSFLWHTPKKRTKENVHRGCTPMYPTIFACYTQKRSRVFAKRTRFEQSADFAFAASKRTAKTEGFSTGRNAVSCRAGACLPPLGRKTILLTIKWGRGPIRHTVPFIQNRTATNFANNFSKGFEGSKETFFKSFLGGCRAAPCPPEAFSPLPFYTRLARRRGA